MGLSFFLSFLLLLVISTLTGYTIIIILFDLVWFAGHSRMIRRLQKVYIDIVWQRHLVIAMCSTTLNFKTDGDR